MSGEVNTKCEVCGKDFKGKSTLDLWMLRTVYEENGEVRKTCEQVETPHDYVVVGELCCGAYVRRKWEELMNELISQGG